MQYGLTTTSVKDQYQHVTMLLITIFGREHHECFYAKTFFIDHNIHYERNRPTLSRTLQAKSTASQNQVESDIQADGDPRQPAVSSRRMDQGRNKKGEKLFRSKTALRQQQATSSIASVIIVMISILHYVKRRLWVVALNCSSACLQQINVGQQSKYDLIRYSCLRAM